MRKQALTIEALSGHDLEVRVLRYIAHSGNTVVFNLSSLNSIYKKTLVSEIWEMKGIKYLANMIQNLHQYSSPAIIG